MSNYFVLQLRQEYGVIIDSDAFLGAFTMDREGQRVKIGPWVLGPGYRPQQPPVQSTILPPDHMLIDQERIRVPMRAKWEKYYQHAAGHIPYAVCKANGAPPLGMDIVNGDPPCANRVDEEDEDEDYEMGGIGFHPECQTEEPQRGKPQVGRRPSNGHHGEDNITMMILVFLTSK